MSEEPGGPEPENIGIRLNRFGVSLKTVATLVTGVAALVAATVSLAGVFRSDDPQPPVNAAAVVSASTAADATTTRDATTTTAALAVTTSEAPSGPTPYASFVSIVDVTGTISLQVPTVWANVIHGWNANFTRYQSAEAGPGINAAPNVAAWSNDFTTPGVFVGVSAELVTAGYDPQSLATDLSFDSCATSASAPATIGSQSGWRTDWQCDGGHQWIIVALWPSDRESLTYLQIKLVDARDDAAADAILSSLDASFILP